MKLLDQIESLQHRHQHRKNGETKFQSSLPEFLFNELPRRGSRVQIPFPAPTFSLLIKMPSSPVHHDPGHVWTGPRLCSDRVVSGLRVEGLQLPYLVSCTREFARGERCSTKSSLMVEGGHVSYHGTGYLPFLFNQSGKFTGCGGWRFAHAVSLHRAKHAGIELDDYKLRVR